MKKSPVYFAAMLLLAACSQSPTTAENEEEPVVVTQYTIEQFMDNTSIGGSSFSPDGKHIAFHSNESGIYNIYTMPITGGEPEQLTNSTQESYFLIDYFPNDNRMLFSADQGGNELNHIYLLEESGEVKDLTPDSAKAFFAGWAEDKNSFFFQSNKRDPRFFDLYEMTIDDLQSTMIYKNETGMNVTEISPDKNYFALVKSVNNLDNEMYLYNRKTKELKHISEHDGFVQFSPQYFTKDNKHLYYLTDEGSNFKYLAKYDLATGKKEKVMEKNWDVWYTGISESGRYQVVSINEDARTTVEVYDQQTGKRVEFPDLNAGDIKGIDFSDDEQMMSFYVGSSRTPNDLYVYDLTTKEHTRLSTTLNPEINADDLVEGTIVRFRSYDGVEIPSTFYKPKNATADNPAPVLVWVHGGPGGQTRLSYSPLVQYLVNHGYAVLGINNRGSSGYGKEFFAMDDKKHGDADLGDVVESKNFLGSLPYIDTSRIAIIGGSYGGYMTMAALAFRPDVFDAGVNIFGVTNWLRTLNSIPPYWESFREALYSEMGDPATDSARLYAISPLFHADKIERPFMVLQGANDPRVLQVESDEIVEAARKNDIEVEYVLFPDEGHGFVKKENELEGYQKILQFLDKHLKKEEG